VAMKNGTIATAIAAVVIARSLSQKETRMRIALIGSTQLKEKFDYWKKELEAEGHEVRVPVFDHHPEFNILEICHHNRGIIWWAEKIGLIWDARSMGTVFDLGMVYALRKPLDILYLEESKTIVNMVKMYAR
jgi:hypothetical protein